MKPSAWAGRWGLVLTYLLTLVLVDGGHRHGAEARDAAECMASCQAPGPHLSGHTSPDLSGPRHDCPACQCRAVSLALAPATPLEFRRESEPIVRAEPALAQAPRTHGHGCRAPPHA